MRTIEYDKLEEISRELINEAAQAMETAYNPYSGFYVGAALLSQENKIITGSNVENAAYGSTICAERAALLRANAMGIRKFKKIAVIARGENFNTTDVTAPCGSCRQMLYESACISYTDLEVIMTNTNKSRIIVATIKELLPLAFGPLDLGINLDKFRR